MKCKTMNKFLIRNELMYRVEESCFRVVSLCNSLSMKEGVCVHSPVLKLGLHDDLYLNNNLLTLYAKCVGVKQARHFFDEMPHRDVVSWTGMQSAYVRNTRHDEALELFGLMITSGQYPNEFTLSCMLRSCSGIGDLYLGSSIHGYAVKAGFESKPVLGSTLIDLYAKCDCNEEAYKVFVNMNNGDTVSWTTMISSLVRAQKWREAVQLYFCMINAGVAPNEFTFVKLLAITSFLGLKYGKLLHAHLIILGINLNVVLKTALVDMYTEYQKLEDAIQVSNQTPEYDVFLWTSIISGFSKNLKVREAISAFNDMKISGILPNSFTYSSMLSACTSILSLRLGLQIHSQVILAGLESDICVGSALINMYTKCSNLVEDAIRVFRGIVAPNVICWTSLISGLAEYGFEQACFEYFMEMQGLGVKPNSYTISTILGACNSQTQIIELHAYIIKSRADCDTVVANALVAAYAEMGMMDDARRVSTVMSHRDVITYTTLATKMNHMGHHEMALKIINDMHNDDVKMDGASLASFLSASGCLGTFETGTQLHCYSVKSGLNSFISVQNSLVDLYGKFGCTNDAERAFGEITEPDVISWNALISGLASNGQVTSALSAFENMRLVNFRPDSVTFSLVLFACSQGGLVDFGLEYFKSMRETHDIAPEMGHYVGLVDLLARANRLEDAMEVINSMPLEANTSIYKTLLGACKLHRNILIGEDMARRGIELDPYDSSFYVLLANLYDGCDRPNLSAKTLKLMTERGLRKTRSESWIEIRNKVHIFITGDSSHSKIGEIHEKIKSLIDEFKNRRYLYQGSENPTYHSENLAVAFGLLSTASTTPIRIMKNKRICGECHEFIKLVTKVAHREIIVRDGNIIHGFKNGECSCRGYR